jgi:hypothetical protein
MPQQMMMMMMMPRGSRAEVMHGKAVRTNGTPGLYKEDLKYNKYGKIVSKAKSQYAKTHNHLGAYKRERGSGFILAAKNVLPR